MNNLARILFAVALTMKGVAFAQTQPTPGLSLPDGPLRIEVVEVVGPVRLIPAAGGAPAPVAVGQILGEGDELRTFPRCRVTLKIEPDQTLSLDRVGSLKLERARLENGAITAEMGMVYGRMRYTIEGAERRYDVNLKAPNSTLGIRGTDVVLYDQPPYPPEAISFEGRARLRDARRQTQIGGTRVARISGDANSAAESAIAQTVIDPSIRAARTKSEEQLVSRVISQGGGFTFDPIRGIPVVSGGMPPTINQLAANPPGFLNFVVSWPGNTNIDMLLSTINATPFDDTIFAFADFSRGASGGQIDFDHRGGPNGGFEVIHFPGAIASDSFVITGTFISGDPTDVSIDVIVNGQVLDRRTLIDPSGSQGLPLGPTQVVQRGNGGAIFLVQGSSVQAAIPSKKRR